MSNDFLFTSESVSEGHPDKVADQVSDAILDAIFAQDPRSRVAAETLCNTGLVVLAGCPDDPTKAETWTKKLRDQGEEERAVTDLEHIGNPSAIEALGSAWERAFAGKPRFLPGGPGHG